MLFLTKTVLCIRALVSVQIIKSCRTRHWSTTSAQLKLQVAIYSGVSAETGEDLA